MPRRRGPLRDDEAAALQAARAAGLELAVFCSGRGRELASGLVSQGVRARVLAEDAASPGLDATAARAELLARCCRELGCGFRGAAVIATCPDDLAAMLEAGLAAALADAGRAVAVAADAAFPPRADGGLAAAVRAVVRAAASEGVTGR